jgi:hypothetical protein
MSKTDSHARGAAKAILLASIVAGTLDILAAISLHALRGVAPSRLLQAIAAGLLGPAAFDGGDRAASLGLALHFAIMTVAVIVYYMASRLLPELARRWAIAGAIFGLAVFLFMTFVVLPLDANPPKQFDAALLTIVALIHVVCVGLPIAFLTERYGAER